MHSTQFYTWLFRVGVPHATRVRTRRPKRVPPVRYHGRPAVLLFAQRGRVGAVQFGDVAMCRCTCPAIIGPSVSCTRSANVLSTMTACAVRVMGTESCRCVFGAMSRVA